MNGEAAVADEHDITPWQPAAKLEDALPGPVGQQLVPAPPLVVGPLGGCKQGQHGQRLDGTRPRKGRQHHETQPAQATGFYEMAMAGAHGIAIDAACSDPGPPPAFDCIIHPDHHGPCRDEAIDDHPQHPSRHRAGIPSGTVENLVKAREVSRLGASGHPQASADGPFTRGQHGAHHQDEHVFPGWRRKARTQRQQPVAQDLGDGIAGTLRDVERMYHPILRIPCRSSCKLVVCGKVNRAALRHSKV